MKLSVRMPLSVGCLGAFASVAPCVLHAAELAALSQSDKRAAEAFHHDARRGFVPERGNRTKDLSEASTASRCLYQRRTRFDRQARDIAALLNRYGAYS